MAESAQGTNRITALHEPLRRLDAVLNFARKVVHDGGSLPAGMLEDFVAARRDVEKQFVQCFDLLDLDTLQGFRNFLQATRDIEGWQLEKNLHRLSRRARGLLHRVLIAEGKGPGHGSEVGDVRFSDGDPPLPAVTRAETPPSAAAQNARTRIRRVVTAAGLFVVLALIGLAAAWVAGAFDAAPYTPPQVADPGEPTDKPPTVPVRPADPEPQFVAEHEGYATPPALRVPSQGIDPIAAQAGHLVPQNLPALMLGLEELVGVIEPPRLKMSNTDLLARWKAFAESVIAREAGWREAQKPLLDVFTAHLRTELHLVRYPAERSGSTVLPSDVLYAQGGSQVPLVVTAQVLAQCCSLSTELIAPNGPPRPELAARLPRRVDTWNGEELGLRSGNPPRMQVREVLLEVAGLLRDTMETPQGKMLVDALLARHGPDFTAGNARDALAVMDPRWLEHPSDESDTHALQVYRLARLLQPVVCNLLTADDITGNVNEAMKLYRLARAAGDARNQDLALLLLGERAEAGAMLDDVPLAYAVAELLAQQGNSGAAREWYARAHTEHPDDPRATLRLAALAAGAERYALLREAYARGEREPAFLRALASEAARAGNDLLALALLDELCAGEEPSVDDIQAAVLQCLALERGDWALARLQRHTDVVMAAPALLRLDLICELSVNGLSDRARTLARSWRERGEKDAFVESLLQRFGG